MSARDDYRWRDRTGRFHAVPDMEYSYVYNVWVMLWDYLVPECPLGDKPSNWSFNGMYTVEYLMTSERVMYSELRRRGTSQKYRKKLDAADCYCAGKVDPMLFLNRKGDQHLNWVSNNIKGWYAHTSPSNGTPKRWEALQVTLQLMADMPQSFVCLNHEEHRSNW